MDQQSRSLVAGSHIASRNVMRSASEGAGQQSRLCRYEKVCMCCDGSTTQHIDFYRALSLCR